MNMLPHARQTISLCMIVKNEQQSLLRCLRSAEPWVDEIIVLDTGSTDRTVEIARSFGARVEHFPWCDDFAAARNAVKEYATCDWILSLDADEVLDPNTAPKLAEIVAQPISKPRCYSLLVRSYDNSKDDSSVVFHSGYVTRLFVNHPKMGWKRPIHEQIVHLDDPDLDEPTNMELEFCDQIVILHDGYLQEARSDRGKAARNQAILKRAIERTPNDAHMYFHLGIELYHDKKYRQAATAFDQVLTLKSGKRVTGYIPPCFSLLVSTYMALDEVDQAIRYGREGLKVTDAYPDLCCNLALAYLKKQNYKAARKLYEHVRSLHGKRTKSQ